MSTKIDYPFLEHKYNFITEAHPSPALTAPLSDFLDDKKGEALIQAIMQIIRAGKPDIAAFHLSSWLAMVCSSAQTCLSLYDMALQVSPERLHLHIVVTEGRRKVSFLFREKEQAFVSVAETGGSRAEALRAFYEGTMFPIFRGIARASATRELQLWPQMAMRLHNEKDYILSQAYSEDRISLIEQDFAVLLNGLNVEELGLRKNPFNAEFRWIPDMHQPEKMARQKIACCLAYQTDTQHGYCYTCPRLDEEGRKAKRKSVSSC
ncbi:(2Fe-2S)-binding protein [Paenibacillus thalictri]|uniref:(2Fe-2S)-binding protein n=1 Tax=Paenibacillus thalictri TaxID=2527873 RepID=A0A4Q9DGM7_9BACL|nr:(2Fe-2S)-binding protein [Paenibacillus thalictri]TBL69687.1 (2Fe-2S)-binding protein [Paenibacillus thalictri]